MADQQEKMSKFLGNLKNKQDQQQSKAIPEDQTESNVYNEDFDDDAIVNAVQKASTQNKPNAPVTKQQQKPMRGNSAKKAQTVPQKKPYQFNKLNEGEKEKVFLDVYDENLQLKEKQVKFEKMYQTLEVRLTQIHKYVGPQGGGKDDQHNSQQTVLIAKVDNLELENEKLKQKISALSSVNKVVVSQPKKKKLISVDKADGESKLTGGASDNQIKELLKLNDMLKKRCLEQESQFRQMQAMMNSKLVNQQELSQKNAQFVSLQDRCNKLEQHLQVQSKQLEDERKRQSEIMSLLRDEKEKNHQFESQIRGMELAQKSVNDLSADLQEAKRQKREIEERLAVLMESPFFKEYNERAQIQAKLKTLEQDQIKQQTEMKNLREQAARNETEIKLKKEEIEQLKNTIRELHEQNKDLQIKVAEKDQQLLPFKDLNYWDNDQFLKVLGNLKWTGEDPAWRKIEFIDRTYMDSDDPNVLRKEIEHLKLEKGELAAHLEKTQTLLKNQQDIQHEKDQVHKVQIDQLQLELKTAYAKAQEYANIADLKTQARQQKTLYEAEGVKYDDSVSVFDADQEELEGNENFFDFYIGKAEFQAAEILASYKHATQVALDLNSLLTFVTVDFYDHETQHSGVVEGVHSFYNLQISFKVEANGAFIQYLEGEYLKLELYVSQGSEATKVATGLLQMKDLVHQNVQDTVSKVISGHLSVYGTNNQFVGIVEFKARMRLPISNIVRLLKETNQLQFLREEDNQVQAVSTRQLVICVEKATNLPQKANTFVYYNFEAKDYHTNTQMGSNPKWDFRMVHQVVYNELFVNQLKRAPLELFLIDDNMPLVEGANDKIGTSFVDLSPLLNNEMIDMAAEVKNEDGERIASIFIKSFWFDSNTREQDQDQHEHNTIKQSWEDTITQKICSEMRSNGLTGITAFRVFDRDKDQVVSLEDFANGLKHVLNIKLNQSELQLYYSKLLQPLNQQNFEQMFRLQTVVEMQQNSQFLQFQQQPIQDLSQINQFVQQNSQQLHIDPLEMLKDQIADLFKNKLKQGKSKEDIFREIDSLRPDGKINAEELQSWLMVQRMNVPIPQLRQFLSSYMDINGDKLIDLREFYNFFLNFGQKQQPNIQSQFPQQSTLLQTTINQDPVSIGIQAILQYAKAKQWTLMQVREQIDQNRNSFIDRSEIRKFFKDFGVLQALKTEQDVDQIISYFDSNGDGQISIQEFSDALNKENNQNRVITKQPSFSSIQNYVVGYFISYMKQKNRSIPQLFNDIDADDNGYLTKLELKQVFRNKILVPIDNDELEQLYREFDDNNDGKISIQEFLKIMKPQMELANKQEKNQKVSNVNVENLTRKVEEICNKNASLLQKAFQSRESKPNLIQENQFIQILSDLQLGFTQSEVDQIVAYICNKEQGMINYVQFINLGKARGQLQQSDIYGQTAKSGFGSLSQIDQERAVGKAKEIFSRISRALKRNSNFKSADLFKTFDLDGNGKLTQGEMGTVFQKMKIRLERSDLDLIFKAIDRDGNGSVDINEFLKYIEL